MATGFTYRHYILKDHLGSWTTITDAEGNVEQELSFDAWGNLRDADTWTGTGTEAPMFDRGYTGHEHMTAFGLINMNGRCYDPTMSSFLSVDEYVQDPTSAQNFNRYAYCLNNPLKYTDPSGWYYVGGGHSSTSLQGPYECTWTLPERRTIDPSLVMDFLDYWTSFWEGEEFKNGGSVGGENTNPQDDWFVNENTGEIYYNNKMGKGDVGKGEMTGSGWKWLGPNGMFNKINPGFLGEEISLIAKLKGRIKITSEDFLMSLLLAGDKAKKVMEDLGYQQVATQTIEYNSTFEQNIIDASGSMSFTYGSSIEYWEKVTYVPDSYVESSRICLKTMCGDYDSFTNSFPYVSRYSLTYGEPTVLKNIGEFFKSGYGIHDYTNYFNGGSLNVFLQSGGSNKLILRFLEKYP